MTWAPLYLFWLAYLSKTGRILKHASILALPWSSHNGLVWLVGWWFRAFIPIRHSRSVPPSESYESFIRRPWIISSECSSAPRVAFSALSNGIPLVGTGSFPAIGQTVMLRAWIGLLFSSWQSFSDLSFFSLSSNLPCSPPFLVLTWEWTLVHSPHSYATSYVVRTRSDDFGLGNSMMNEVYLSNLTCRRHEINGHSLTG
jgi:hypothetical protein